MALARRSQAVNPKTTAKASGTSDARPRRVRSNLTIGRKGSRKGTFTGGRVANIDRIRLYVLGARDENFYGYDPKDPNLTVNQTWTKDEEENAAVIDKPMYPAKLLEIEPDKFDLGYYTLMYRKEEKPRELPCARCKLWFDYGELNARIVTWVQLDTSTFEKKDMLILGIYCKECVNILNRLAGVAKG